MTLLLRYVWGSMGRGQTCLTFNQLFAHKTTAVHVVSCNEIWSTITIDNGPKFWTITELKFTSSVQSPWNQPSPGPLRLFICQGEMSWNVILELLPRQNIDGLTMLLRNVILNIKESSSGADPGFEVRGGANGSSENLKRWGGGGGG